MEHFTRLPEQIGSDERLILLFWALGEPLTVPQMIDRGLLGQPGLQEESYERTFRRMREDLRSNGIYLEEVTNDNGTAWRVDKSATYMAPPSLIQVPAMKICMLLEAYLASQQEDSQPGGEVYLDRLRRAHDKLVLGGEAPKLLGGQAGRPEGCTDLEAILDAYVQRRRVGFAYTDAKGSTAQRDVEVYGVFRHSTHMFLVAYDLGKSGMRVFRDDRIEPGSARVSKQGYEVPADFSIAKWRGLPFEYGPDEVCATFQLVGDRQAAERITQGRGAWADATTWQVVARNEESLCRWAVKALQAGLRLTQPEHVRDEVARGLERTMRTHG